MTMSVCLSVFLFVSVSVRSHNPKTARANFTGFCASDGNAIGYVLPVVRMSSYFHTVGPTCVIKHDVMFRTVRQVALPVGRKITTVNSVEFVRMQHRGRSLLYTIAL